jgi:hypothetical protein
VRKAQHCQKKSWFDENVIKWGGALGGNGRGTDEFCEFSNNIEVQRTKGGATAGQITGGVIVQVPPSPFNWCEIPNVVGLIAGVFVGGLGAFFGSVGLIC